ncbi:hypothetical protein Pgin01_01657 [Porphyromonas gingivalis]
MLVRSKQKQDCPLYNCLKGTTYNIQNISALTANQGTNTLAFSYAELTFSLCPNAKGEDTTFLFLPVYMLPKSSHLYRLTNVADKHKKQKGREKRKRRNTENLSFGCSLSPSRVLFAKNCC